MADIVSGQQPVKIRRLSHNKIVKRDTRNDAEANAPAIVPGLSIESLKREELFTKTTAFELLTARIDDVSKLDDYKHAAEAALKAGEIKGAELKGVRWQIPAQSWYNYLDGLLPQGGV